MSETIEPFYNLLLEVKNLNSVYESLDKHLQGEVISGYTCNGCQKKVNITKRTLLKSLPNVLII